MSVLRTIALNRISSLTAFGGMCCVRLEGDSSVQVGDEVIRKRKCVKCTGRLQGCNSASFRPIRATFQHTSQPNSFTPEDGLGKVVSKCLIMRLSRMVK